MSSGVAVIDLGAPAQRTLLAVLLASPGIPVSDDRLIDDLWGDHPPPSARHLLRVYVSRVRNLLREQSDGRRIVRDGPGYAIHVEPGELDAERFGAAVADARRLAALDPGAADRVLATAMRLWRGSPFADLPDPPQAVREHGAHLERLHGEALDIWIDVRLQLGRHRELVPELADFVEQHPYDEAAVAHLMLALYRSHRQAEALGTARALEDRLRDDLGIDPSREIRDLYREILLQDPQLSLEPPETPGNLPSRLSSFVGRKHELEELAELLREHRLITLTGTGGIGKTRLALEVARLQRSRFPGGTWWVDLAPVTEPETVLEQLAGVLGLAPMPGPVMLEAIARALGRRKVLLLIDNCEHVAAAVADVVVGLLGATTGPRVLATSRAPLRVEGERLWPVPPLSLPPDRGTAHELDVSDAVRLFVERGRAASPQFTLDVANAEAVGEVCRRLDGLSLAIEMAAARLAILSPAEIARHLDDRFALLEQPAVGRPTRHRTMEAAIDASQVLLSEREQSVFERLAVFVGSFDLDAAGSVGLGRETSPGHALAAVTGLVDASMLTVEHDDSLTRYRLLETLREYGLGRLRRCGIEDDVRQVHAEHYLGLAAQAGVVLDTPEGKPWMTRLARDYAEVRQALAWSLVHQARAATLRAAPALRELWFRRGNPREAGRWTAQMLDGDVAAVPPGIRAEVHAAAAYAELVTSDLPMALSHADKAIRLSQEVANTKALLHGLWIRASIALASGDFAAIRRDSIDALEICGRNDDRWGRAGPLANLGFASLFGGGTLAEARDRFEEAIPLYRELGDLNGLVVTVLAPLSTTALKQGDLPAAERYAMEAVELSSGTGWEAAALVIYGEALAARGDLGAADAATTRALSVALNSGLENWFRMALRDLARTTSVGGRLEDAAVLLGAARRNMPAYGFDPAIWGPIEERCREGLGPGRFDRLAERGAGLTHDELIDLVQVAGASADGSMPMTGGPAQS